MQCPESLRVQAFVDGEVDALDGADIERHLQHCADCRTLRAHAESLRHDLRSIPQDAAPSSLRRDALAILDTEDANQEREDNARARRSGLTRFGPRRWSGWSFWTGMGSGLATAALAAVVVAYVVLPARTGPMVDEIFSAHVNALMSSHLVEVESTDHHTVKPWFAGRIAVSPAVADFTPQDYALRGGRIDELGPQRAAVLVYRHGLHVIDVYCWPAPTAAMPDNTTRRGYHLAFWRSGDLAYAAVSDTGWDELLTLERLIRAQGTANPQN